MKSGFKVDLFGKHAEMVTVLFGKHAEMVTVLFGKPKFVLVLKLSLREEGMVL